MNSNIASSLLSIGFLSSLLRVTTPILLAAIGGSISSMAGVKNIALEGTMLVAAFVGVAVSAFTQNLWLAVASGIVAGVGITCILAWFALKLRANIFISAIALNMFASGITIFILSLISHDKSVSSSLKSLTIPNWNIPLVGKIPVIGAILSGHNIMVYVSLLCVVLYSILMYRTPFGLRVQAVGQNPDAASSVGIRVFRIKLAALMLSGVLASLGGLYLSMGYVSWFSRDMTGGRGFIAVAASALGMATPLGTMGASFLFGIVMTFSIYLSSLRIPSELIQIWPYIATVAALAIYSAKEERQANKPKKL
ncbi:MAG: ABC transporter permease [Spirochaetes bacterium]|nr:ABC transporter permease [Spirochaetota bacterium]